MSQKLRILNHLKRKPITALDALRLAARIYDLRCMDCSITSEKVRVNGKEVAKYCLTGCVQ